MKVSLVRKLVLFTSCSQYTPAQDSISNLPQVCPLLRWRLLNSPGQDEQAQGTSAGPVWVRYWCQTAAGPHNWNQAHPAVLQSPVGWP